MFSDNLNLLDSSNFELYNDCAILFEVSTIHFHGKSSLSEFQVEKEQRRGFIITTS